jgi:hypothetical protein
METTNETARIVGLESDPIADARSAWTRLQAAEQDAADATAAIGAAFLLAARDGRGIQSGTGAAKKLSTRNFADAVGCGRMVISRGMRLSLLRESFPQAVWTVRDADTLPGSAIVEHRLTPDAIGAIGGAIAGGKSGADAIASTRPHGRRAGQPANAGAATTAAIQSVAKSDTPRAAIADAAAVARDAAALVSTSADTDDARRADAVRAVAVLDTLRIGTRDATVDAAAWQAAIMALVNDAIAAMRGDWFDAEPWADAVMVAKRMMDSAATDAAAFIKPARNPATRKSATRRGK